MFLQYFSKKNIPEQRRSKAFQPPKPDSYHETNTVDPEAT